MPNRVKSNKNSKWHNINWIQVENYLSNVQENMVVAYKNGDLEQLHKLQLKLIMSFEARAFAVRKVTTNDGKKSPGADGILWSNPKAKYNAIALIRKELINPKKYKAEKIRRVWIPKPYTTKLRPLGIPTMTDRAIQAVVSLALDPIIEETSDNHSYGSRKFRSPHDAINRTRHILDKAENSKFILDVNIENCFDNLSHEFIMKELESKLCNTGKVFVKKWLKAGVVEKGKVTYPTKGIPQGGVISPMLCNMCLNGIEEIVRPGNPRIRTKAYNKLSGCWVVRFVDDIIITSPDKNKLINDYLPKLIAFLKVRGLNISKEKSKILNLEKEKLYYLGWTIRLTPRNLKYNKKGSNESVLIIEPSSKGIRRVKLAIKSIFRLNAPMGLIIKKLNPIIRGWTNYYRISFHSQKVFAYLSKYIYHLFWLWAFRIHPNQNRNWIYEKYVFSTKTHKWQFGRISDDGDIMLILDPKRVLSKRVAVPTAGINPYVDKEYYEKRFQKLGIPGLEGFRKTIYAKHKYRCAACGELLDDREAIELHRITPGKDGGKYTIDNTVPLHKTCHESVTHAKKQWFKHLNIKKSQAI